MHRAIERPSKYGEHVLSYHHAVSNQAPVVLFGDSIVYNLSRYEKVWNTSFQPLNATNCGIRGDRTQNVMWRAENVRLSSSTTVAVIHCGINDVSRACDSAYGPHEIATNIITCGKLLVSRHQLMSIIIMGVLPAAETFPGKRSQINEPDKSVDPHNFFELLIITDN